MESSERIICDPLAVFNQTLNAAAGFGGFVNPAGGGLVVIEFKKPGVPMRATFRREPDALPLQAAKPGVLLVQRVAHSLFKAIPGMTKEGVAPAGKRKKVVE
ncbi:MAG TPA: hypothetical protein VIT91_10850 [Chthoniobacterales bacterium]